MFKLNFSILFLIFIAIILAGCFEPPSNPKCLYDTDKSLDDLRTAIEKTV